MARSTADSTAVHLADQRAEPLAVNWAAQKVDESVETSVVSMAESSVAWTVGLWAALSVENWADLTVVGLAAQSADLSAVDSAG